jgi:hypothetical protein
MADIASHNALSTPRRDAGLHRLLTDLALCRRPSARGALRPNPPPTLSIPARYFRSPTSGNHVQHPNDSGSQFPNWQTMGWWIPAGC